MKASTVDSRFLFLGLHAANINFELLSCFLLFIFCDFFMYLAMSCNCSRNVLT